MVVRPARDIWSSLPAWVDWRCPAAGGAQATASPIRNTRISTSARLLSATESVIGDDDAARLGRSHRPEPVAQATEAAGRSGLVRPMPDQSAPSDPANELAELQDSLYDLIVTRIAQSGPHELRGLIRDAHEAAALAEELAEFVLRIDEDDPDLS